MPGNINVSAAKCEPRGKCGIIRSLFGLDAAGNGDRMPSSAIMSWCELPSESGVRAGKSELESGKQFIIEDKV